MQSYFYIQIILDLVSIFSLYLCLCHIPVLLTVRTMFIIWVVFIILLELLLQDALNTFWTFPTPILEWDVCP